MADNGQGTISVEMSAKDVYMLAKIMNIIMAFTMDGIIPRPITANIVEHFKPFLKQVLEKSQIKVNDINKRDAIDGLNIKFQDEKKDE